MMISVFDRVENIVGKGENVLEAFFLSGCLVTTLTEKEKSFNKRAKMVLDRSPDFFRLL